MEYEDLYRLILDDELGWEHLISSIVREEEMDPMDIDIIKITDGFLSIIANNKIDFRYGGKFVHTAAILLKMKSDRVTDEILKKNIELEEEQLSRYVKAIPFDISIMPKIPIIRNRKITFTELIETIRESLRYSVKPKINFKIELKEIKMEDRIKFLIEKLIKLFAYGEVIAFSDLLTKKDRKEFIYTFLPLLFLTNMGRVELEQEEPFKELYVKNKRVG
jgi:segregation and condensation protein A